MQLLIESLLLSLTGGALGLLFASWAIVPLARIAHETVPRLTGLSLSREVLAFNLVASVVTGILFGLAPALKLSKTQLQETLKDTGATSSERQGKRLRGVLVVAEVALSVTLLVGAGLLVKSMFRLLRADNGFDPNGVLTMELKVSRGRFGKKQELSRLLHQVLENVKAVPGVDRATISANIPGLKDDLQNDIASEGYQSRRGELIEVDWSIVTADYFQTMRIPLLHCRTFHRARDEEGNPVVLVYETLAQRFWPHENALGKHIAYDSPIKHEIIGVVKQVGDFGSGRKPLVKVYTPAGRF